MDNENQHIYHQLPMNIEVYNYQHRKAHKHDEWAFSF